MNDMKSEIYMVIAMPKQFLWAPFEVAIINIVIAIAVMLVLIGVLGMTPFFALLPLIFGHAALIGIGTRNPHLFTTLQSTGKYHSRRKNLAQTRSGVKFVP